MNPDACSIVGHVVMGVFTLRGLGRKIPDPDIRQKRKMPFLSIGFAATASAVNIGIGVAVAILMILTLLMRRRSAAWTAREMAARASRRPGDGFVSTPMYGRFDELSRR
ncbi:hypothetical protein BKA67DRAFT_661907 [Truncatella angustata]|uniref:Uncharacterized protein n=1 Tax=Truncatella angustata TaxID=152316 RepID=A0A9P8UFI5_9PEZI|nr:uncharacterized protein BKA67DRAFT_661907 [Truncatella angustata]KAH6648974.1 hypothetical protein BKA67DRAFT_661907 [Truncatella angustata]